MKGWHTRATVEKSSSSAGRQLPWRWSRLAQLTSWLPGIFQTRALPWGKQRRNLPPKQELFPSLRWVSRHLKEKVKTPFLGLGHSCYQSGQNVSRRVAFLLPQIPGMGLWSGVLWKEWPLPASAQNKKGGANRPGSGQSLLRASDCPQGVVGDSKEPC